jgi:hypothetical protein
LREKKRERFFQSPTDKRKGGNYLIRQSLACFFPLQSVSQSEDLKVSKKPQKKSMQDLGTDIFGLKK